MPPQIVIASGNSHKAQEIQSLLGKEYTYLTLRDFPDAPEVKEDASSFAGNAVKKALSLVNWLKQNGTLSEGWILADDSGLEVDVLDGAPGVHSARYASTTQTDNSSDEDNNSKLLRELTDRVEHHRTARFRCVIALAQAGEYAQPHIFEGSCEGRIAELASGEHGFGYDPLFIPNGFNISFGELGPEIKSQLSHRGAALRQLKDWLAKL